MSDKQAPGSGALEGRPGGGAATRLWGPWAWVLVLAIIGAVQLVRQQWFAAGLFLLAALVLGVDLARSTAAVVVAAAGEQSQGTGGQPDGRPLSWHRSRLPLPVLLLAAAVAAVVLTVLTRHSGAMAGVLAGLGVLVVALGWPGDRGAGTVRRWPVALRRLAWAWAAIWIAGGLWELVQVLLVNLGQDLAAAPLSELLEPVLADRAGQAVFVVVWLVAGVYLLRRGRQR